MLIALSYVQLQIVESCKPSRQGTRQDFATLAIFNLRKGVSDELQRKYQPSGPSP